MYKKFMMASFSLLLLLVLAIPVSANPVSDTSGTLSYEGLNLEQQEIYDQYSENGYDVSILKSENDLIVISGVKNELPAKGFGARAAIEYPTYSINQTIYFGNYHIGGVTGTIGATIINNASASITSYNNLTYNPYWASPLTMTYTPSTFSNTIGSGYAKLYQSLSGTVQYPTGGLLSGQTIPLNMSYTVTASTGQLTFSQN